jgi:hypothetical protein
LTLYDSTTSSITVQRNGGDVATNWEWLFNGISFSTTSEIITSKTELSSGTSYTFSIIARNFAGSTQSSNYNYITLFPSVTNLNFSLSGNAANISWAAVPTATYYIVKRVATNPPYGNEQDIRAPTTSASINGLIKSVSNWVSVSACNSVVCSVPQIVMIDEDY